MPTHPIGNFTCEYENIAATDARHRGKKRILSVEGKLRRTKVGPRSAAPNPLIGSMKEYLAGAPALQTIGYNNGHLIGLSLGGPDDTHNIAPMYGHFNEFIYRGLERAIENDAAIKFMRVAITYDPVEHALPTAFRIFVKRATDEDPDCAAVAYAPYDILPMDVPSARPYPFDEAVRKQVADVLPAMKPTAEPYACLEMLNTGPAPRDTSEFTELQKKYILTANALYNLATDGVAMIKSDDPTDPITTLNIHGGDDRPQIDHVIARSLTGANSFRNAMVLSKRQNGIKSNRIDPELMSIIMAARDVRPVRNVRIAPTSGEVKKAARARNARPY